jgi:hypothetical protein
VHGDTERCNIPVPSGACSTPAVCKPSTPLVGRIRVPASKRPRTTSPTTTSSVNGPSATVTSDGRILNQRFPSGTSGPYVAMPKYWSSPNAVIAFPRMSL